jgi:PAS domain S-box-containing protein
VLLAGLAAVLLAGCAWSVWQRPPSGEGGADLGLSAAVIASVLGLCWAAWVLRRQFAATRAAQDRAVRQQARCGQLEQVLHASETRFQFLTDGMSEYAFFALDPAGKVLTWNEAAEKLHGFRGEEVVGRPFSCLYPPEDVTAGRPDMELKQAATRGRFEDRAWRVRKDGTRFWTHVAITAVRTRERRLHSLLVMTRDISEVREAQEALRRSHVQYRNLTDNARDVVLTISPEGRITSLNPAFDKVTGWLRADWVGQPFTALVHPDDQPRARELLAQIFRGELPPILELHFLLLSREYVAVEFMATPQVQDGQVVGCLGMARDVSERKRTEETLRNTEAQLRQAQKMEAVGLLAGGIAHDFNNLLTVILGCSDLLLGTLAPGGEAGDLVQEIKAAGERAALLTRQLLAFSRKQVLVPRVLDLNALVHDLEKMLRRLIGEDIDLEAHLAAGPLPVRVDPGQLEQVLLNLAVNARDAMPKGGRLTVQTRRVDRPPDGGGPAGPCALLSVSDTGCGMDEAVKAHLFEPFFTTKEPGKGTGLGLATVYGIIEQSGGHIEVQSEVGRYTRFQIFLPLVVEAAPADGERGPPA